MKRKIYSTSVGTWTGFGFAVTAGLANLAHAATWDGGTAGTGTTFSTAANWVGDVVPPTGDSVLYAMATVSASNLTGVVTGFGTTGTIYLNSATAVAGSLAAKTFTSWNFGTDDATTTKLPSANLYINNGLANTAGTTAAALANQLTLTGDADGNYLKVGAGVASTVVNFQSTTTTGVLTVTLSATVPGTNNNINVVNATSGLTIAAPITGTGGFTKIGAGTLYLSTTGNSYTGNANVTAGTLRIANGGSLGSTTNVTSIGDATMLLDSGAAVAATRTVNLTSATSKVSVTAAGTTAGFLNGLGGTGSLTKTGLGQLTTAAADTYLGSTTVSAGTFRENGTHVSAGGYAVAAGAAYGGSGVVTLAAGNSMAVAGTLTPGAAATATGVFTVNGNVALTDGTTAGTLGIDYLAASTPAIDSVLVSGNLNLAGGTLAVTGTLPNTSAAGTALVIATYGTLTGTFSTLTGVDPAVYTVDYNYNNANQIALVATGVPEPTTLALLGLGGIGIVRRRRRA